MVLQNNILNNQEHNNYLGNDNFLFIDDQTKDNKIIFMIFNKYVFNTLIDYFLDFHVNNVIFIKENHILPNDLIQEIMNYEHLVEYGEYDKA